MRFRHKTRKGARGGSVTHPQLMPLMRSAGQRLGEGARRAWSWWAIRDRSSRPVGPLRLGADWAARISLGLVALSVFAVVLLRWVPPPTTAFILRERVFHRSEVPSGFHRDWVALRDISRRVAIAVVAAEDQRFPSHHGFDLTEIRKALREEGRRRGASTISQQVAKNLFLWPGGWVRKGLEAYLTILVEGLWPKRRILEVYLNVAEFGPGVFGVQAASMRFFGKPASELTRFEAARLAAVLPSPKRMSAASPSSYVWQRAREIDREVTRLGGVRYLDTLW